MLKQKFRRGNLVYDKYRNRNVIILGSYDDFFDGGDIFQYSVMYPENGNRSAWYGDNVLTLVDEGGEHLIEQAKENKIKMEARKIIRCEHLNHLSEGSIVTLLRFIGIDYSKSNNYFGWWKETLPLFLEIKESKYPELLKDKCPDYDIEGCWKIFHEVDT
jgi:hypothetical protein